MSFVFVVFVGMGGTVLAVVQGTPREDLPRTGGHDGADVFVAAHLPDKCTQDVSAVQWQSGQEVEYSDDEIGEEQAPQDVLGDRLFDDLSRQHRDAKAPPMDVALGFYEVHQYRLYNAASAGGQSLLNLQLVQSFGATLPGNLQGSAAAEIHEGYQAVLYNLVAFVCFVVK